jgi:trk system potassium uptake protein
MKIIIAGAGEVGFHLAKLLSYESQEITLVDCDKDSINYASNYLDIRVVKGDASSVSVLKEARVEEADLFIAVTSSQNTNITVCLLAKQLGVKRTIARVTNSEFIEQKEELAFSKIGIDELICPEYLASSEIQLLLDQYAFNESYEFEGGVLTMVSLRLSKNARFVGKTVQEAAQLHPNLHFIPIAIQRYGTQYTIIPRGGTPFLEGDKVVFITSKGGEEELIDLSKKEKATVKNVMVLGGSTIGVKTADALCKEGYNVKLLELNRERATEIADELLDALVINGDGRNAELLEEENVSNMDAFISATSSSETNIMASLMAKAKGVHKTIALVENMDYFKLSHSIGIDSLINKKILAANSIFRYIREGDVVAMTKLNNMNAELLEFVVKRKSKICNKQIKDVKFPTSATIGGVIRGQEGIIALGDFKIQEGDRVVVCSLLKTISEVEKFFK